VEIWQTKYFGTSNFYTDSIEEEGTMINNTTVSYQVCAVIPNGNSPYSTTVTVQWMA
jgi:hypothetical protein